MITITQENSTLNTTKRKPAVRAVILKDNELFLMHLKSSNTYVLPGGSVDEDENLETALRREVLEETGYDILSFTQTLIIKENHQAFKRKHYIYRVDINDTPQTTALTQEEQTLGMTLIKLPLDKALELLTLNQGTHPLSEPLELRELIAIMHSTNQNQR